MSPNEKIRVVELFAGVGGFRLGLESCDADVFETVWANQWEPGQKDQWAFKCYERHFGDGSCVNKDIATVINDVPEHDLLVGGFPCQDYSVAHSLSTSAGIEGKKGVLWWSIYDIIKLRHPKYVLLENVDRLLKSPAKQRGRDFGIILKCLDMEDYAVEWRVVNAADYGSVQRRRRTFIFAAHKSTKQYRKMHGDLFIGGTDKWLSQSGFFAKTFPVNPEPNWKKCFTSNLNDYRDLVEFSDEYQAAFYNSGVMFRGRVFSAEYTPNGCGPAPLGSVIVTRNKFVFPKFITNTPCDIVIETGVEEKYFLQKDEIPKWEYMKGAKKIERTSGTGFSYTFSEGPIAFPDPLDRPSRTMLTSEGTKNRTTHIIEDPATGRLRKLTPEECEAINGFPCGWTYGAPDRQRYFMMGNALVVPLVERMGQTIKEII